MYSVNQKLLRSLAFFEKNRSAFQIASVLRDTHSEGLTQITRISQIFYGIFGYPLWVIPESHRDGILDSITQGVHIIPECQRHGILICIMDKI